MKKRIVRLTENDIRNIVKESVKRVLNEWEKPSEYFVRGIERSMKYKEHAKAALKHVEENYANENTKLALDQRGYGLVTLTQRLGHTDMVIQKPALNNQYFVNTNDGVELFKKEALMKSFPDDIEAYDNAIEYLKSVHSWKDPNWR